MSSSTAIPVSPELISEWARATSDDKPYRYLQIKIQKETLNLVASSAGTPSVSKDFDEMQPKVADGESCYFLFRIAGPKNWVLISYVPEAVAKVSDKMVYAATKNTLKSKLGPQFINEEVHFTTPSELSYSYYVKSKEPVNSFSEFEKMRQKIHQEEEEERVFRSTAADTRDVGTSQKIGGYHQVTVPITDRVKEEIEKIKSGIINFVELRINDAGNLVEVVNSKSVGAADLAKAVTGKEPRFYLYTYQKIRSPGHQKANTFIYYCPEDSPQNLRMVYATCKPTVAQQVSTSGFQVGKKLEVREASDLSEEYLQTELFSRSPIFKASAPTRPTQPQQFNKPLSSNSSNSSSARPISTLGSKSIGAGEAKAASPPPHPIYSLIGISSNSGSKKNLVMPPPGAYG